MSAPDHTDRFAGLRKLPEAPAAKLLAAGNAVLQTPLDLPASATVPEMLAALEAKAALLDMLLLLCHALPPREATWFACLAARETVPEGTSMPAPLRAAEAWVFKPGTETRAAARAALDAAGNEDETALCAMAASMADGTLGPGELEDYAAPSGAVGGAAFGMALTALYHDDDKVEQRGPELLARALDIARGGNGALPAQAEGTP